MNHIERVMAAIEHRAVDKVPKGELGISDELMLALTGDEIVTQDTIINASKKLNMDLINTWCAGTPETTLETEADGKWITQDAWGSVRRRTPINDEIIKKVLEDVEDTPKLKFPEMSCYDASVQKIRNYKEKCDLFIMAQTEGVLTPMTWLYGFEDFMVYTCTDEEIVAKFAMELAEHYAELAKRLIDAGADAILIGDDIAYNSGTYISPESMREIIFPALRHEVECIKKYKDIPVFMHTDGDLRRVMDDIVGAGFDGLQSLQPTANMDIRDLKARYGEKLCLMGNIDINEVLPFADEETVRRVVRETIDVGIKGSGYILSTCNILTRDVPLRNAVAMYDEAEKYQL